MAVETSTKISPLAPKNFASLPPIRGVRIATAEAGIKYKNRTDLVFMIFDEMAEVAGVFTRSKCPSAPVDHCRSLLKHQGARAIVINSGNANAFTGKRGKIATDITAQAAAKALKCDPHAIYLASTGVIGEPMQAENFSPLLDDMAKSADENSWLNAAKAIMTTDTFPKLATRSIDFDGTPITINAIAKGAGMIAPDMATMLSFIVTDAPIKSDILQHMLGENVKTSFNAITVDSDTSTSDTVLLFSTNKAVAPNNEKIASLSSIDDPRYTIFSKALHEIMQDLALQIICDGEGARHLIEVKVQGAKNNHDATIIAKSIANSPLVKTAIAGEDANWGRVVMAVGKAGVEADRDRLSIWFGPHRLALDGERDPYYNEQHVSSYMKAMHIVITVDLNLGDGQATIWTCDLTKEYVTINGDYRS